MAARPSTNRSCNANRWNRKHNSWSGGNSRSRTGSTPNTPGQPPQRPIDQSRNGVRNRTHHRRNASQQPPKNIALRCLPLATPGGHRQLLPIANFLAKSPRIWKPDEDDHWSGGLNYTIAAVVGKIVGGVKLSLGIHVAVTSVRYAVQGAVFVVEVPVWADVVAEGLPNSYYYGYEVGPDGHFHHERRGQDGVTYGCYGHVDPNGKLHVTHYVADSRGYRVVEPNKQVLIYLEDEPDWDDYGSGQRETYYRETGFEYDEKNYHGDEQTTLDNKTFKLDTAYGESHHFYELSSDHNGTTCVDFYNPEDYNDVQNKQYNNATTRNNDTS
ncbi:conserved hypothetical protein [Culex quinquefasciatus]|uniref:Cuticle protein n=1 Tax=Culex quinquefasciatus TaxID=7176 RepID=B0WYG6_CULQU|nr:conserved hypothetical protein [Culex quinquefasciatus]|eukprot:XP_001862438.1 conserved hypothetical protein [Culex quinquefasciatus]